MKALLFITMIACACAGNTFLGKLQKNYEKARAEFDQQYEQMQKLQAQAEDLSDLAAAGGADPSAVVDTINGLTEAAKFWGSFVGNQVFDQDLLEKKISQLHKKKDELNKYASEDGQQAMVALNQAIWDISVCIKQIQSLAKQLKSGAQNVQMITNIAFQNNEDMLMGSSKKIYEAAIKVLLNTLKSANDNCGKISEKLNILSKQLITIETEMSGISDRLKRTAEGESEEFKKWRKDIRAKVYGGCAACVVGGPGACVACYAIAAGVLESEIAKYKRETDAFVRDFTAWSETFETLSVMAGQASAVSKDWYNKTLNFKDVIQSQYNLIEGTQDVLYLSHALRANISSQLITLIEECDNVIADTTGKLAGHDESQLFKMPGEVSAEVINEMPEEAKQAMSAQITQGTVTEQIHQVCKALYSSNQDAFKACIQTETAKLMDM